MSSRDFTDSAFEYMQRTTSADREFVNILEGDLLENFAEGASCFIVTGVTSIPKVIEGRFVHGPDETAFSDIMCISVRNNENDPFDKRVYFRVRPGNFPLFRNQADAIHRAKFLIEYHLRKTNRKSSSLSNMLEYYNNLTQ